MKYVITQRVAQKLLPRYDGGSDWGVERKLLATGPGGKLLVWWTGHKTWIHLGCHEHVPGELMVQRGPHDHHTLDHARVGETRLTRVLASAVARAFIREHFVDDDEVIKQIHWRETIDVKEAK